MPRNVDNSAGAGLNGAEIGKIEKLLETGDLAMALPEIFFGFGIVIDLCRQALNHSYTT